MHTLQELTSLFTQRLEQCQFPNEPYNLYSSNKYFLQLGGKRIRPILCLMGNELFGDINEDAFNAAVAIEFFHNFTLVHDDIMDASPLRRGQPTVHEKYSLNTALLSGDVLLIKAYEYLHKVNNTHIKPVLNLFNTTAIQVCEGQQFDIDCEKKMDVTLNDYINMITLKTSVLLAASLAIGGILAGATAYTQKHLYEFGKNLGIAFQIQDDYLDTFGDSEILGKTIGGDIKNNKKTFLLLRALAVGTTKQKKELLRLLENNDTNKVEKVITIFKKCEVPEWAAELKEKYLQLALQHFDDIAIPTKRKEPLHELSIFLVKRHY